MATNRRVSPGIYRAGRNRWRIVVEGVRNPATGKRRQIVRIFHGNLREAEEFQSSIKLAEGRFLGHSRDETSVGQLIQLWLSQKQHASTTRDDIERVIRLHISDNVKNMKVSSLTTRHVDMLYGSLLSDGVSAHRIKRVHDVLRAAFEQAVVWDLVARNPVDRARRPPVPKPHPTAPEASEVQRLLEVALRDPDDYWFYVFLVVSISMGMRRGEVLALKWNDIGTGVLTVRRSLTYGGPEVGLEVGATKTSDIRRLSVTPRVMEILDNWRERSPTSGDPDSLVFAAAGDGHTPWFPDTVSRKFRYVRDQLGLSREVTLKNLRHFSGTELMGVFGPVVAAGRLGHKRASTTADYYAAYRRTTDSAAADHIDQLMFDDVD